jgi:4a-hydroxytetrahydrobiopterin dehydratase
VEDLATKKCMACEGGVIPLNRTEAEVLLEQVNGWRLSENEKTITKYFAFKDFAQALSFVNAVGAIAEEEGHHPDIELSWGKVKVSLTTHAIKGLSENDFILAAKIDRIG